MNQNRTSGLTGNQLKIIALIAMTCDHVGLQLLPQFPIFRIIGRIAFPIFAYFIAEGCRHTRNRKQYLLNMAGFAAVCQLVSFFATGSLYLSVLVSFTVAIGLIYLIDWCSCTCCASAGCATASCGSAGFWAAAAAFQGVLLICWFLPSFAPGTDLGLDYGFCGILLPCLAYLLQNRRNQLILFSFGLVLLSFSSGGIQWFCLLSLPLLALYNGKRGKHRMKYLFYFYYPAHLAVIYLLSLL